MPINPNYNYSDILLYFWKIKATKSNINL